MEYETYADVIDAYNSGVGVEGGETLTDYIKRNNIKIKEIQTDDLIGSRSMDKEGIAQLASARKIDPSVTMEMIVEEFIKRKRRRPRSIDELKEFYELRMGTARDPGMEVVKELVEDDKTRITLAGGSFPDLNEDGEITQADILIGKGVLPREKKQSGGLAAILGL